MEVNKVEYNGNTLIDLTNDTVTENDLPTGVTAHNASGEKIEGSNPMNYARQIRKVYGSHLFSNDSSWYRIGISKNPTRSDAFLLTITSAWRNTSPVNFGLLITSHFSFDASTIIINQLYDNSASLNDCDKIRVIMDKRNSMSNGLYLDVHKNNNEELRICITNLSSNNDTDAMSLLEDSKIIKDPEITENDVVFEHIMGYYRKIGIVADKAKRVDPEVFENYIVSNYEYTSDVERINNWFENIHNECPDRGHYEGAIGINTSQYDIPGGLWYTSGYRWALTNGGYQEVKSYSGSSNGGIQHYSRSRFNGAWTPWQNMSAIDSFANHIVKTRKEGTTIENVNEFVNNLHINSPDNSCYEAILNIHANGLFTPGTGTFYISGFRNVENYGYQEAKRYGSTGMVHYSRSIFNGNWSEWKNMVPS